MSLTGELAKPSSPVTQYLRFVGSIVADAGQSPWAGPCKRLLGLEHLPTGVVVAPVAGANAAMVGTAFDYRLRYHLDSCEAKDFVAWKGASLMGRLSPSVKPQLERFFKNLNETASNLSPAGRQLDDSEEAVLSAYCVVLAQFESVFRTRGGWKPELPKDASGKGHVDEEPLLQIAPEEAVRDVVALSESAVKAMSPLIPHVANGSLRYHPNPLFGGSSAIGGADADFIIESTIFELKTTKSLKFPAIRDALLQLVGYSLLDYDDEYGIRRVGVYFSRQEWVRAWPIWELVFPRADVVRYVASGTEPSEQEVTIRIETLRDVMKRVVEGEPVKYDDLFS